MGNNPTSKETIKIKEIITIKVNIKKVCSNMKVKIYICEQNFKNLKNKLDIEKKKFNDIFQKLPKDKRAPGMDSDLKNIELKIRDILLQMKMEDNKIEKLTNLNRGLELKLETINNLIDINEAAKAYKDAELLIKELDNQDNKNIFLNAHEADLKARKEIKINENILDNSLKEILGPKELKEQDEYIKKLYKN